MLVAELATLPLQSPKSGMSSAIIPIGIILVLELGLSILSMKSIPVRKLLCGKPVILIENGHILQSNLRKTRITQDELIGHLREKDVLDPRTVQFAILETSGDLSVFPYPKERPATARQAGIRADKQHLPVTLISDGKLLRKNLALTGRTEAWLQGILREKKATVAHTWLLTVAENGDTVFYRKEST
jgi:uncharacterized membrane protein YcaP (DUF421 family)